MLHVISVCASCLSVDRFVFINSCNTLTFDGFALLALVCCTVIVPPERNHSTVTQAERYAKAVVRSQPGGWEALREALVYGSEPQPESGRGLAVSQGNTRGWRPLSLCRCFLKWPGSHSSASRFCWFGSPVCVRVCRVCVCVGGSVC